MKTKFLILGLVIMTLVSCNGNQAKKGVKLLKDAYKSYSESGAKNYYRMKNMESKYEWLKEQMSTSTPCSRCQGWGVVAYIDAYGNFTELDNYGNPVGHVCPDCGGDGVN